MLLSGELQVFLRDKQHGSWWWRWSPPGGSERTVLLPTSGSGGGLPLLVLVALVEVIQVSDVGGLHAHQAGQTLHVLITGGQQGAL